jgi:hypothetical protein
MNGAINMDYEKGPPHAHKNIKGDLGKLMNWMARGYCERCMDDDSIEASHPQTHIRVSRVKNSPTHFEIGVGALKDGRLHGATHRVQLLDDKGGAMPAEHLHDTLDTLVSSLSDARVPHKELATKITEGPVSGVTQRIEQVASDRSRNRKSLPPGVNPFPLQLSLVE